MKHPGTAIESRHCEGKALAMTFQVGSPRTLWVLAMTGKQGVVNPISVLGEQAEL